MALVADVPAVPPHAYYSGTALSAAGQPVPGATVLVQKAGTAINAQLFTGESAGTTKFGLFLDLTSAAEDVSSTLVGFPEDYYDYYAFDDNTATRWSSAFGRLPPFSPPASSHEWIWVDCGADVTLRTVWVDFQHSAAVDYTIRLLTNGVSLSENGQAGGGPDNWTIIATGTDLPNGLTSPNRKLPGVADEWDFANGTALIPDNTTGTATVNVTDPVGRYLMVDATEVSDAGFGNLSIWEITVEPAWTSEAPVRNVVYTTESDNYVEQANPIVADENGSFAFYVENGDYDIHISGAGGVAYSLTDVTLINPHRPHSIRSSSQTPPLTLVEKGEKTSGGNNVLSLGRPGSTDANNPPTPYRIMVNKGKQGWAQTLNADWDETTDSWKQRTIGNQSYVLRINGEDHSLEYGNDYSTTLTSPVMETLFRVSADGEMSAKAFSGGYEGLAMEVKNNTGGTLNIGNVVVLDPSDPFAVIKPRKYADENPAVVYKKDGSRVFIMISGRMIPNTTGTVNIGDLLVTQGAGSLQAVAAPAGVDPRAVLGRVSNAARATIIP